MVKLVERSRDELLRKTEEPIKERSSTEGAGRRRKEKLEGGMVLSGGAGHKGLKEGGV